MSWLSSIFGKDDALPVLPSVAPTLVAPFHDKALGWLDTLAAHVKQSSDIISPAVYSRLRSIDDVMRPFIKALEGKPSVVETEVAIESMLTDYIPTPLNLYVNLPAGERTDSGRADLILLAQYDTLETAARELSSRLQGDSVSSLETHAIFIRDKFGNV